MKRERQEGEIESSIDVARYLMLLSNVGKDTNTNDNAELKKSPAMGRVFSCKTCNKKFPSFQALGGHRASHKKPKHWGGDFLKLPGSPPKPKTHRCSICGLEFPIGQALGGHMRRHRAAAIDAAVSDDTSSDVTTRALLANVPVLKKSNSSKRVMCLDLNLSLAPPGVDDDHLNLLFGKAISNPALKCFT